MSICNLVSPRWDLCVPHLYRAYGPDRLGRGSGRITRVQGELGWKSLLDMAGLLYPGTQQLCPHKTHTRISQSTFQHGVGWTQGTLPQLGSYGKLMASRGVRISRLLVSWPCSSGWPHTEVHGQHIGLGVLLKIKKHWGHGRYGRNGG